MQKWLITLERVSLFLLTLGLVAFVMLNLQFFIEDWKSFYIGAGNVEMFIYLMLTLFIVSFVFRKLLVWEVHTLFSPKRRRRR